MPTEILLPTSYTPNGGTDDWDLFGAATEVIAVSDDLESSKVSNPQTGYSSPFNRFIVGFADLPLTLPVSAIITSVILKWSFTSPPGGFAYANAKGHSILRMTRAPALDLVEPGVIPPGDTPSKWRLIPPYGGVMSWDYTTAPELLSPIRVWTVQEVNALEAKLATNWTAAGYRSYISKIWLEIGHTGGLGYVPPSYETGRSGAARMLRLYRNDLRPQTIEAPVWASDIELLDDITASSEIEGYGVKGWERSWSALLENELDLNTMSCKLTALPMDEFAVFIWDAMISTTSGGHYTQGVSRLFPGTGRAFKRESPAWVPNSAVPSRFVSALNNVEKITADGTLFESKRKNWLLDSSFRRGTTLATGWTQTTGVTVQTALPMFSDNPRYMTVVGTPGADREASSTNTAVGVGTTNRLLSIYHWDPTGHPLYYWIKRISDGWYWNDAGYFFQSVKAWNIMSLQILDWGVSHSKPFSIGATALQVGIGLPNGGLAGQANWFSHVQLIESMFPMATILVNEGVALQAEDDTLIHVLPDGKYPRDHGTVTMQYVPLFNLEDHADGAQCMLMQAVWDNANQDELVYVRFAGVGQIVFRRTVNGVIIAAPQIFWTPRRGVPAKIGMRWIGAAGEQGLAPYTVDVFVDGVKGNAVVGGAIAGKAGACEVRVGHRLFSGGTISYLADGAISQFDFTTEVLSNDMMKARP